MSKRLVKHAAKLPHVAVAKAEGHGCSRLSMENIRQTIEEEQLNRVVIGGCSPRTHLAKFQDLLGKAGLNKYLVEIANIRDQATWVHSGKTGRSNGQSKRSDQNGCWCCRQSTATRRSEPADE